ncbi:MAG: regulatory protein RecX [Bryobacteraceae bacterium]
MKPLTAEKLMEYALRLLGGRALSIGELRDKLGRRAEKPDDIDPVLARMKELGYLNDVRFADAYAAARLENQGFGRMRVLRDLRQRRVAPVVAERAVEQVFQDTDEAALIEEFLRRKFRGTDLPRAMKDEKKLASAYRRLRYAGFSSGASIRVLKRYAARAEELETLEDGG